MHTKRRISPNLWPNSRYGTKYLATPSHDPYKSVPLLIFLRDVLNLVKIKKEAKDIINQKNIAINGKVVSETNYPLGFLDILEIIPSQKHYQVVLTGKRLALKEIKKDEASQRIYKIIGKKLLKGKKIQINLDNGRNLLASEKFETGDFVLLEFKKNKILKTIKIAKGTVVTIIGGKHAGKTGKVKEVIKEGGQEMVTVDTSKEEIKSNIKNIYATQ